MDQDLMIVDQNEMVLDMDNFDFNMIDEDALPTEETVEEVVEEVEEVEEAAEEAEEAEESEEEESEEEAEEVVEEDDEEEVDFDEYEIDLPNGEKVVLSDLVKGYKTAAEVEAEVTKLKTLESELETKTAGMDRFLKLAKLEAERVIEDYEDFDWVTLAKEDPQSYVENREFLDKYKARHKEIIEAQTALEERDAAEKTRIETEKARSAAAELARDIPGWNENLYVSLMKYAVEKGASEEMIKACTDPFVFKLLHKNMEHEKGVQKVKAKVKKVGGAPKKVVKSAPAKPAVSKDAKREAMIKKAEQSGDMTALFHLLVD